MPYKDIAIELAILLGFAVVTAFTVNFFSPKGIALLGEWDTSKGVITARAKADVVVRELEIQTPELAKEIYDKGNTLFVDARAQDTYDEGHIKGAVSLPVNRFDERVFEFTKKYPISTTIITYCSGRECEDSHELAQYLIEAGYPNVSVFADGYPGWLEKGYPIEE